MDKKVPEAAIIKEYLSTDPIISVPEILERYKISHSLLYTILMTNDIPTRQVALSKVVEVRLNHAIKMYQTGLPLWQISQETGIAQPRLHSELHLRNIPLRRPRKNSVRIEVNNE